MIQILLASHGPLARAMKETAEFLLGKNEYVHYICAYVDEESKDLQNLVDQWQSQRSDEDTWIVITDVFGGSVNNEFMMRMGKDKFYLIAGMSLPLLLSVITYAGEWEEKSIREIIDETKDTLIYCNDMMQQEDENEDF